MIRIPLVILTLFSTLQHVAQVYKTADEINPLTIGTLIPEIEIHSLDERAISIRDIVSEKPTVILFYRGGWCPYCNLHLAAIAAIEKDIKALGYQIIGISPDAPENLKASIDKNELNYQLYSDASTNLIQAMGIAIEAPDRYSTMLLDHSDNKNSNVIPVPAAFIVNSKGEILYVYSDPNYKERITEEALLETIKNL